jgi:hypothetical protein
VKRALKILALLVVLLPLGLAGYVWYLLQPRPQDLPLPAALVSAETAEGRQLLELAGYKADYPALAETYQSQALGSYCGVASSVIVLNALGADVGQSDFFIDATDPVRTRMQVTLGGMSLVDLAGLLRAHGLAAQSLHGDQLSLAEFRELVARNLSTPDDYLLVNYQREALGQGRVGHISPLAAYNADSDQVLILDTASYKYPHTWVPLELLYGAMQEQDSATGRPRGLVEVSL